MTEAESIAASETLLVQVFLDGPKPGGVTLARDLEPKKSREKVRS